MLNIKVKRDRKFVRNVNIVCEKRGYPYTFSASAERGGVQLNKLYQTTKNSYSQLMRKYDLSLARIQAIIKVHDYHAKWCIDWWEKELFRQQSQYHSQI